MSVPFSTLGGGDKATVIAVNHVFRVVYGGDDGARTRDLCRDRTTRYRKLLIMRRTGGSVKGFKRT